jgi:hypothetical protein
VTTVFKDKDIDINRECCVRRNADDTQGKTLNLRVGDPGWHKNATNLTVDEAKALRAELDLFITANGG